MAHIEGKAEAVKKWLQTWDGLSDYVRLNALPTEAGAAAVNVSYTDLAEREFINGTADRVYLFSLVLMADWSDGYDDVNARAIRLGEKWLDWVSSQYEAGNTPDFGDGVITAIEPVYNTPAVAAVYEESHVAKYLFQAKIKYRE